MNTNKPVKIEQILVAYDRFKVETDNTIKVQIIDKSVRKVVIQLSIKKELFSKATFEELQAIIRFKARKGGFILPKTWSFLRNTV